MKRNEEVTENRAFTQEDALKALEALNKYADGKSSIDHKATENQEWWRLRHWNVLSGQTNEGTKDDLPVGSAWAVNSLLNKHADMMDSLPKPNILPREAEAEEEAKTLSSIIPVILDQNDYEEVYRNMCWDIDIDGSAITGVFWDSTKKNGMGDIAITNIDVHNLFWEPGIEDIQDSDKVFYVTVEAVENLKKMYPDIADKIGPEEKGIVKKYIHDDNIDTSNCATVTNLYYKKTVMDEVKMPGIDENGMPSEVVIHRIPKTILHFAIMINSEIVFASENEKGYENGYYDHGKYPFVIRKLFPVKDSPWGFGYLDIMKHPQRDIDKLDQAILKNAMMKTKPRFWVRKNAAINKEEFADWNNELIEVATGELNENVKQIDIDTVPAQAVNHLMNKIDELKETSGNRDFSQGSTAQGITAASAIAALQEAGSKLSRDINKELYRGCREEYYLIIELIRQFYDQPRSFRVNGDMGEMRFVEYDNSNMRDAIFDISVSAEKKSPFSRAAQNEMAKEMYQLGFFAPDNTLPALACIDMMDFEGKDKVIQTIQQNSQIMQQFSAAMDIINQAAMAAPAVGQMATEAGLIGPDMMSQQAAPQVNIKGTPEERAAGVKTDNSLATQMRQKVAEASNPGREI